MPLIGIDCDFNGKVSTKDCLECARNCENKCQFTYAITNQILDSEEHRNFISVTTILGCLRKTYLERTNDFYDKLEYMWWRFRGNMAHAIVEKAIENDPDFVIEKRFKKTIAGVEIFGKPDVINTRKRILYDYKSCAAVPKFDKPYWHHAIQTNMYRYMINDVYPIDKIELNYFSMKDTKRIHVPIMEEDELLEAVTPNIITIGKAFKENIVPEICNSEDEWQCRFCTVKDICTKLENKSIETLVNFSKDLL